MFKFTIPSSFRVNVNESHEIYYLVDNSYKITYLTTIQFYVSYTLKTPQHIN